MYIACDECGWGQDDFYDEKSYNPALYLLEWNKYLFSENIDEPWTDDAGFIEERGNLSTREVIAQTFEKFAHNIRNMKWITYEQYEVDCQAGKAICPKCGNKYLNID